MIEVGKPYCWQNSDGDWLVMKPFDVDGKLVPHKFASDVILFFDAMTGKRCWRHINTVEPYPISPIPEPSK